MSEHLAAMAARGWTWSDQCPMFIALGAMDRQGCPIINMRVEEWETGEWVANFGVPGIGYGTFKRHATPMEAADEAEAWLRSALAPLALPWLRVDDQAAELWRAALKPAEGRAVAVFSALDLPPIPMELYCPHCCGQHIDAPEPERGWTNPPHKSHLCHHCGAIWRPADVPTVGVVAIRHGSADRGPEQDRAGLHPRLARAIRSVLAGATAVAVLRALGMEREARVLEVDAAGAELLREQKGEG